MSGIMSDAVPDKVVVEVTTRCNLRCRMCLKQAQSNAILDRGVPCGHCRWGLGAVRCL